MITEPSEFRQLLLDIQNSVDVVYSTLPSDEPRFIIDANSRTITIPIEFQFLGVKNDHNAETIYFEIDRYFDAEDLSQHTCVIQFSDKNNSNDGGIYPVTTMDTTSVDGKIIFGWEIKSDATSIVGDIYFSVRFYSIDNTDYAFTYNFNTLTAKSSILDTLDIDDTILVETYPSEFQVLTDKINDIDASIPEWAKENNPDKSLKLEGKAADAKAVGDELAKKANTKDVGVQLDKKANTEDVKLELEKKADKNNPEFTGTMSMGRWGKEDTENKYAHIVVNGTLETNRSNAHTVDWDGNGWYAGKLTQEGTPTEEKDLATKKYVDDKKLSEFKNDSNYERCKYFNFIEAGVNVEGNPTYDEIKEAILSDVTPVLIHGHYIAHMTSGHWDSEGLEREELPGFTFVTHRSDMNNHWKIKYTEFWCTKQDDGSTLWAVGEHYYIEDFVAKYGVSTFSEIQNAYNDEKIIFCTDGWLVTKLDIFAPDNYAQFSGLDDQGNPALLTVTAGNNKWTRTNITNVTTDYLNDRIKSVNATIANQKTFVAEYNVTTFSEIQNSYNSGKAVICKDGWLVAKLDIFAPDDYAQFSGLDDEGNPALLKVYKNNSWIRKNAMKASADFVSRINSNVSSLENSVDSIAQYINGKDTLLSALSSMNTVDILKSVYNFRGGFCDNAGTLHIKNPGIYLVIAGGTGNKQITIKQPGTTALEAKWNGVIVLAYEGGVVTPIGIESSLTIAGAFKTPGTFQGWTTDGSYSTTINYPAKCVVAYLGNSNVDYLE